MGGSEYHFFEEWFIPASSRDVYDVLCDSRLLSQWWRGVYLALDPLDSYSCPRVGNRYRAVARGFLPYRLRFILETAILDPAQRVGVKMEGDLCGTWTASLHEEPGGARVSLEQHCTSGKPLIRLLSPVFKPLFAWNHRWTTPRGEHGLREFLQSRGQLFSQG